MQANNQESWQIADKRCLFAWEIFIRVKASAREILQSIKLRRDEYGFAEWVLVKVVCLSYVLKTIFVSQFSVFFLFSFKLQQFLSPDFNILINISLGKLCRVHDRAVHFTESFQETRIADCSSQLSNSRMEKRLSRKTLAISPAEKFLEKASQ